jgi:hypothetical protein
MQAERFIDFVKRKGSIAYAEAYKMIHLHFPDFRDFEGILAGALNSGQIKMVAGPTGLLLVDREHPGQGIPMQVQGAKPGVISPDTRL